MVSEDTPIYNVTPQRPLYLQFDGYSRKYAFEALPQGSDCLTLALI